MDEQPDQSDPSLEPDPSDDDVTIGDLGDASSNTAGNGIMGAPLPD